MSEIKRKGGWVRAGLRDNLKRMGKWIKTRKLAILVVLGWSISVALVMIKSYLFFYYIEHPAFLEMGLIYSSFPGGSPYLYQEDYLLIFAMGFISGALLFDPERILHCWIASTLLSLFIPVIFSSFFIWYTLEAGEIFPIVLGLTWTIEEISYIAFLIFFRMLFPLVPILSLLAAFVAAFLRDIIRR